MMKKILSVMLVLTVTFGTSGAALAAEDQSSDRGVDLKSHGKITYQDDRGEVVIDSQDFYKLEQRINLWKQGVTDQLNTMHTYFTTGEGVSVKTDADVCVAHTQPAGDQAVDPVSLDFGTLLEGIAASQSVPSDVTAYDYPAGTELYINEKGALTQDGSEKGAKKTDITAATADNLSAGTAAWVDGKLVLGTGGDNKSYKEEGYKKGLAEGTTGLNRHAVDLRSSKSYTVPHDISNAFVFMAYSSHSAEIGTPYFSTPDGSSVPCSIVMTDYCNHDESHAGNWHLYTSIYYIPKLKANTVVFIPQNCPRGSFIYFTK